MCLRRRRRPLRIALRDARHRDADHLAVAGEGETQSGPRPARGDWRPISTSNCRRSRPRVPAVAWWRPMSARTTSSGRRVLRLLPRRPEARRLAASLNVDLSDVTPTGPRGRIVEADVRAFADSQAAEQAPAMPPGLPEPSRSEPLSGMRRGIAQHMSESLRSTAQLSYFLEVDVTEAQRLRREASAEHDTTLTIAHVLIKGVLRNPETHPDYEHGPGE